MEGGGERGEGGGGGEEVGRRRGEGEGEGRGREVVSRCQGNHSQVLYGMLHKEFQYTEAITLTTTNNSEQTSCLLVEVKYAVITK